MPTLQELIAQAQRDNPGATIIVNPTKEQMAAEMANITGTFQPRPPNPKAGVLVHGGSAIVFLRNAIWSARRLGHVTLAASLQAELENACDLYDACRDWALGLAEGSSHDTFYRLPVTTGRGQWQHQLACGFVDGGDGAGGLESSIDRLIAFPGLTDAIKDDAKALKASVTTLRKTAIAQGLR